MRRLMVVIGLLALVGMGGSHAHAAEPVIVTEADTEIGLGLHLDYLEDKEGTLTIEDVLKPEVASQFTKSQVETSNFGFTNSAYWFSFRILVSARQLVSGARVLSLIERDEVLRVVGSSA